MARWMNPTRKDVLDISAKFKDRPRHVRAIAKKIDFFSLYWLPPVTSCVVVCSVEDDGSLMVSATREYNNSLPYDVLILGVDPADLRTCELPDRETVETSDRVYH
jgi:hypothetical protein